MAPTIFVDNHQFKGLKNNMNFNIQKDFPAMSYMKSADKLAPGPQFCAPPHDPDPRADASGLLLQSGGGNSRFLEHNLSHPKVGNETISDQVATFTLSIIKGANIQ